MKVISKKLCIYMLCASLISSSVFMSYGNMLTVKAIDEGGYYKTAVGVCLTLAGIIETLATGGSFSPVGVAQIVTGLSMAGIDLKDHLTDNGDGTYTITPEFIQMCIDEAKRQEESYFSDYESIQNIDGTYNISGYDVQSKIGGEIAHKIFQGTSAYKIYALKLYPDILQYNLYIYSKRGQTQVYNCPYDEYWDGLYKGHGSTYGVGGSYFTSAGVNVPIFTSHDSAYDAFESGDFSSALNYREKMFEYGSIYAPVYNGGSVTIRKEALDGFDDKLKEVNEKYDDVDDRINALYEYIFNNNTGNNGSGNGFDFDFDIDSPFDLGDLFNGLFKDWEGFGSSFITSLADFFKELAEGMKKKFPFSIPWDIYHIFTVFSNVDSPQASDISTISFTDLNSGISVYTVDSEDLEQDVHDAPYFKLPIKVESFGIYEEIIVDMKDFQTLSTFSRTMFSLLFAVFLLKFTIKILSIFGVFGGGDD